MICTSGTRSNPDRTFFNDVLVHLGPDRVHELLGDLADELVQRFRPAARDTAKFAFDAHAMIPGTWTFGFVDLSDLCRKADEACRTGSDVSELRSQIEDASLGVLQTIEQLRLPGQLSGPH